MRFRTAATLVLAALFLVPACAHTPAPGDPGYPYNLSGTYSVRISVQGMSFRGTAELETRQGGVVSGTMHLTSPYSVRGDVSGTITGDQATLTSDYEIPSQGCVGRTHSEGTVAEGGGTFSAGVSVDDSCGGMMSGRITFTRQ